MSLGRLESLDSNHRGGAGRVESLLSVMKKGDPPVAPQAQPIS